MLGLVTSQSPSRRIQTSVRKFNPAVFVNCKWLRGCAARNALFSLLIGHLINRTRNYYERPLEAGLMHNYTCTNWMHFLLIKQLTDWLILSPTEWLNKRHVTDMTDLLTLLNFITEIALAKQQILWSTNSLIYINRRTGWQINRTTGWLAERPFEYRVLLRNSHASRDGMSHLA
jgi:hypothetical protein